VSALHGAHSGTNVLAPTAQGDPTSPLDFNGFISINFAGDQPISRFGWRTNPQGGNVVFPPHMNTFDSSNTLVNLSSGIAFTASPREFVAFAFDATVIKEVELFQGGPMTVDDFTFASDNKLPFGVSSVPEPSSSCLMLAAAGLGLLVGRKRFATSSFPSSNLCRDNFRAAPAPTADDLITKGKHPKPV